MSRFHNNEADDRQALIAALEPAGFLPFAWEGDDGEAHISVTLLDASVSPAMIATDDRELKLRLERICAAEMDAFLSITSTGSGHDSAVVLFGEYGDPGPPFQSQAGGRVGSLAEAVAEFKRLWNERDHWLWQFVKGYTQS